MPTRIVREGILDSDAVNQLSDRAELFYRRLMSVVDDYGRFDGRPALIRVRTVGLQLDRWTLADVEEALEECSSTLLSSGEPLVTQYEVDGKPYVQINNFGQRVRSASKYPAPDGSETHAPSGKVYFILATESKRIKIGYTEWKPESRMGSLQTGMPEKLELLGWMPGSRADEATIQRQFAHLLAVGEWFDDNADLRAFITDNAQCRTMPHDAAQVVATRTRGRSESEAETKADAKTESESESEVGRSLALSPQPILNLGEFGNAKLTEEELHKLHELIGPERTNAIIDKFDTWVSEDPTGKVAGGKRRKDRNPYKTIRRWISSEPTGSNRNGNHGRNNHAESPIDRYPGIKQWLEEESAALDF